MNYIGADCHISSLDSKDILYEAFMFETHIWGGILLS
jgi:hypothetical protein